MVKQTRKFPGIGKKSGKLERRLWSMRELLKYQCLNTYLTPMLKPSKPSDLFPHAHQNQRMSKYCICWTSTWRRFVKVFSVVLYTVTPLFFGFRANWKFSGPRWNIPFRTSQMRHLEVSGTVHLSTTMKDQIISCVSGYDSSACLTFTQVQITMSLHKVREITNRR